MPRDAAANRAPRALAVGVGALAIAVALALAVMLALREPGFGLVSAPFGAGDAATAADAAPAASTEPRSLARTAAITVDGEPEQERRALAAVAPGDGVVRVVWAATGAPAAGATVWYWPRAQLPPGLRGPHGQHTDHDEFRVLRDLGASTVADASGRAVVALGNEDFDVAAALGDATGLARLRRRTLASTGGDRVEIAPTPALRVEVRDALGSPVPDAPLGARVPAYSGWLLLGHTDNRGVREFARAEPLLAAPQHVRVRWPGCEDTTGAFDPATATLRITLPANGAIELRLVDARGEPVAGHHAAKCGVVAPDAADPELPHVLWEGVCDADGTATLRCVPLGRSFEANVDGHTITFAGPTAAGETTRVDVVVAGATVFRGRVVDAAGEAIARTAVVGRIASPGAQPLWPGHELHRGRAVPADGLPTWPGSSGDGRRIELEFEAITDASGRFAFTGRVPPIDGWDGVLVLLAAPRSPDCRHACFAVPATGHGRCDLGDLAVGDDGLVLSGQVVDERGRPVHHAMVEAQRYRTDELPRDVAIAAGDGSFRVYRSRSAPAEPIQLTASALDCQPAYRQAREGEHGVRMVVRRAPQVRIELVVDPEVAPLGKQVEGSITREGAGGWGPPRIVEADRWVWIGRPGPGPVDFAAELADDEPFARTVVPCEDGHEHVHRFDLRGRFAVHEIEVRGTDGQPLDAACELAAWRDGELRTAGRPARTVDGVARVLALATARAATVVVTAEGHERVHVTAGAGRSQVVLRRLPVLRIRLATEHDLDLTLRVRMPNGSLEHELSPFRPATFDAVRVEVAVHVDGEVVFALPLAPIAVRPGMDPDVPVELSPDQVAQLRAAARR
jgi:hypothetical protein